MTAQKNIHLLGLFNFLQDFTPYNPFAVIYFSQVTGSFALGLSVMSITAIASAVFEVPTGIFSDMIGRKRTILIGSIASAASLSLYAIGGSYWMLALGAAIGGISMSFFSGNNDALLYESLQEDGKLDDYAKYAGRTASMFQVGLGSSALVGAVLAYFFSLSWVMWASVIPQLLCVCISLLFHEPTVHRTKSANLFSHLRESLRHFRKNRKLQLLTIGSTVGHGIGETMHQFMPAFIALLWPSWTIGIARMLSHVFASLGFWFCEKFVKRFSALQVLFGGQIFNRIVGLIAYGFPTIASPVLSSFTSFFFGTSTVASGTLMQREFTVTQRATMSSLNTFFGSIFFGIFAYLFGFVADHIGAEQSLVIGELLLLPLIGVYLLVFRHDRTLPKDAPRI